MAKELTTDQAFEELTKSSKYWGLTGLSKSTQYYYRSLVKHGNRPIGKDTKERLLTLAGFTVMKETEWDMP